MAHPFSSCKRGWALPRDAPRDVAMPCRLCLQPFCWVGFDQEQSVLGLSPGRSYCCLGFGFLITCNIRSLPWGAEGLLANITSHLPAFEGL